nr:splicing factor [Tanacetum cinerariifolium]
LTIKGNVNETHFESIDEYESSDEVEKIDYVDFHTEGDADVAASAQDKNKGKAIQEGSNSKSAAKLVRKSKRLRQEKPQPFRIYVKNRGRSEMIAKLQGKNFKFDAQGTGSTPDKAFDVSESK